MQLGLKWQKRKLKLETESIFVTRQIQLMVSQHLLKIGTKFEYIPIIGINIMKIILHEECKGCFL